MERLPADVDPVLAARAEEVRAFLVELRGGSPFLSPVDGALLVDWLEEGVPLGAILRGIEATAERRRAKRVRTPFSLKSCRGEVQKALHGGRRARAPGVSPAEGGLEGEAHAALAALAEADPAARADAACAIVRAFHARAWEAAKGEHPALLAAAAESLADLREAVDEATFAQLCEEHARDAVRARYPAMSITRVWEDLGLGVA
ncbi:MAG: hypothetical protein ACOZNI_33040 [Myxococcota bacterium]